MKTRLQNVTIALLISTHMHAGHQNEVLISTAGVQPLPEAGCIAQDFVDGYPITRPLSPIVNTIEIQTPTSPGTKKKKRNGQISRQSSVDEVEIPIFKECQKKESCKTEQPVMTIQKKSYKVDFLSYITLKLVVEIDRKFKNREEMAKKFIANFKTLPPSEQQTRIKNGAALCGKSGRLHPAFRSLSHEELTTYFKQIDSVTFTTQ